MTLDAPALFVADGEALVPTGMARGPWSDDALHGGPALGLLARAVEATDPGRALRLARLTTELLRPIAFAPLRVEVDAVRERGRVHVLRLVLFAGEQMAALAHASLIVARPVDRPERAADVPPADAPDDGVEDPSLRRADGIVRFHSHAVDVRAVRGRFGIPGPATCWVRMRVPLVAGEATTPAQRAAVAGDLAGMGSVLGGRDYTYPNADVTLALQREPEGEWLRLDCTSDVGPLGVGVSHAEVADRDGTVGRALQTLVVARRPPAPLSP